MTFSEFLAMGDHGFYVWTSYGVGLFLFAAIYMNVKSQNKAMIKLIRRRYLRQEQQISDRELEQTSQEGEK